MSGVELIAAGWFWALIGCCIGAHIGHQRPMHIALCAALWPALAWLALCEWVDARTEESDR